MSKKRQLFELGLKAFNDKKFYSLKTGYWHFWKFQKLMTKIYTQSKIYLIIQIFGIPFQP